MFGLLEFTIIIHTGKKDRKISNISKADAKLTPAKKWPPDYEKHLIRATFSSHNI